MTAITPVSTQLRGIMRAMEEEANREEEFGHRPMAAALRHYREMIVRIYEQALEEEGKR